MMLLQRQWGKMECELVKFAVWVREKLKVRKGEKDLN